MDQLLSHLLSSQIRTDVHAARWDGTSTPIITDPSTVKKHRVPTFDITPKPFQQPPVDETHAHKTHAYGVQSYHDSRQLPCRLKQKKKVNTFTLNETPRDQPCTSPNSFYLSLVCVRPLGGALLIPRCYTILLLTRRCPPNSNHNLRLLYGVPHLAVRPRMSSSADWRRLETPRWSLTGEALTISMRT